MDRQEVLVALGPGGTTELAERVLALLQDRERALLESVETVLGRLELAGLAEVCAELGRDRATVGHWIAGRRGPGGFPSPFQVLSATPVWDLAEVRKWSVETRGEAL